MADDKMALLGLAEKHADGDTTADGTATSTEVGFDRSARRGLGGGLGVWSPNAT